MQDSIQRVKAVIRGELPDRTPLYDLLRNDEVVNHFAGRTVTPENGHQVTYQAYEPAIDATRPPVRTPNQLRSEVRQDGRTQRYFRWTVWVEPRKYRDGEHYAAQKRKLLDGFDPAWNQQKQDKLDEDLAFAADQQERLGEVFLFPIGACEWLTRIYEEVGLEQFCYYLADYPDLIVEQLECHTIDAVLWAERLPEPHGLDAVVLADDLAFKTGPFLSPRWFESHYFSRLARICDAYHDRGIKILFHSDGDLNPILDGLVQAGVDGLNPIETLANMDVGQVHRRHPHLFLAGGIDVSRLLPYGKPAQIKDVVRRAIDAAEGRLMVGSTTEVHDDVPLENFLAMRDAVLEHAYR